MALKIVTIGVYGFTEESFYGALRGAEVDLLCDIRARRGLRGAKYAFANSTRLQASLDDYGIGYLHVRELAPTDAAREAQRAHDKSEGVGKRVRDVLCDAFVQRYEQDILDSFDLDKFLMDTLGEYATVAFLCVERPPDACHRSILAQRIHQRFGLPMRHLLPCE